MEIFYADDDIDDVAFFAMAVNEIIENPADIALYTYSDGIALLDDFEVRKPTKGIVFLDINMPAKDGFETLNEIRNKKGLQIPVIMYSTSSNNIFVKKSIENGANLYVIKPTHYKDIKEMLQKVIKINWNDHLFDEQNFVVRF